MDDTISRQSAISVIAKWMLEYGGEGKERERNALKQAAEEIKELPVVQPTLYGYKIEHLAYIARVMQKEGVTAEYAVRTFGDISRALRMIIEETQEKVMETLNERYDLQTGGD